MDNFNFTTPVKAGAFFRFPSSLRRFRNGASSEIIDLSTSLFIALLHPLHTESESIGPWPNASGIIWESEKDLLTLQYIQEGITKPTKF